MTSDEEKNQSKMTQNWHKKLELADKNINCCNVFQMFKKLTKDAKIFLKNQIKLSKWKLGFCDEKLLE